MDKLADEPEQLDKSPYAYAWNNPVNLTDPDGNFPWPLVLRAVVALTTREAVVTTAVAVTGTAVILNGVNQYARNRNYSVQDNTSVIRPKLQPILKTTDASQNKEQNSTKKDNKVKPDSEAGGDHSTLKRSEDGEITNTATYKKNPQNPSGFDEVKRVDVKGKPHFDKKTGAETPTPHVHEKNKVRPAKPEELPKKNN